MHVMQVYFRTDYITVLFLILDMLSSFQVSVMGMGPEEKLSIRRDKNHVLFGGTKILQHTPDKVVHLIVLFYFLCPNIGSF